MCFAAVDGHVDIHEGAIESFINFRRPKGAVEMHPLVRVHVEETPFAVRKRVAPRKAENARPTVFYRESALGVPDWL